MLSITLNAVAANLLNPPLGVAVALSEAGGFAGAVDVLWQVNGPPGSISAPVPATHILGAPFTASFVPDVAGAYLVRLLVTDAFGLSQEHTRVIDCALPNVVAGAQMPAPGETTEMGALGWADRANGIIHDLHDRAGSQALVVRALNDSGAPYAIGTLVTLTRPARWAETTGGVQVAGARADYVSRAEKGINLGLPFGVNECLGLVLDVIPDNAIGRVLLRGCVPFNSTAVFGAGLMRALYSAGTGFVVTAVLANALAAETPPRAGRCIGLSFAGDAPGGLNVGAVLFAPEGIGTVAAPRGQCEILDAQAVPTELLRYFESDFGLIWLASQAGGASVRYCVRRGAWPWQEVKIGRLLVAWVNSTCNVLDLGLPVVGADPGVSFSGAIKVLGGVPHAYLKYTSAALGDVGVVTWTIEEVWP